MRNVWPSSYLTLGCILVDEHNFELYLSKDSYRFYVGKEEIEAYAFTADQLDSYIQKPNPASIVTTTYREQLVRILDPLRGPASMFTRENGYVLGSRDAETPFIEIGKPTDQFFNRVRVDPGFLESTLWRLAPRNRSEPVALRDLLPRLITIKVWKLAAHSIQEAIEQSDKLIHAAFFEMAYLKRLAMGIVDEWPFTTTRPAHHSFRPHERHNGRELPFPRSAFNSDIVNFYLLGISSNVPVLQFLSFYQVLEYFFVSLSDEQLYQRLTKRLNDPRFTSEPKSLDRLIQDVTDHKRMTDETEMLKLVLERYVDENELIEFIKTYEDHLGEQYYTKRRRRFGIESEVKLLSGHLMGNVAKVVKAVRNALVHSSDHHERIERHVPFSEGTRLVEMEVPLLKFLAERVIIASSS
jgi:hypothetical protein